MQISHSDVICALRHWGINWHVKNSNKLRTRERFGRQVCYLSACFGFWRSDAGISCRYRESTSSSFGDNKYLRRRAKHWRIATLKNVINLLVTSEVRPDIWKSVLSKSRLHAFMEKNLGTEICIKFEWRDFDYRRLLQQEWFERGRSKNRYGRLCCVKTNRFGKR